MSKPCKIDLDIVGPSDSTLRIDVAYADGRESHYLPSAFKIETLHPLWPVVVAAVRAGPSAERDESGLYWMDKDEATRALTAAKLAARKVRA